jgi:hypothetical protein
MEIDTKDRVISADFTVADLAGRWRSPVAAEVFPGVFGIDDFWLRSPFWGIHFNAYADPGAKLRLFELIIMGTFCSLDASAVMAGAREVNFSRTKVALALHDAGVMATARQAGSGDGRWQAGAWQDVSLGGCPPLDLPGVDDSPLEYDLLGLDRSGAPDGEGDRLYFGQRHHDERGSIWTRRAPGLLDYYVVRVVSAPPRAGHGADWGPAEWTRITSTVTPRIPE